MNLEQVWNAALADPEFLLQVPDAPRQCYREMIKDLPHILCGFLTEGVILQTLVECRILLLRYALEENLPYHIARAYPVSPPTDNRGWLEAQMMSRIATGLRECMEIQKDSQGYKDRNGYSSENSLLSRHPRLGLHPVALSEYRAYTLTISRLLEIQPALLLKL